MRQQNSLHPGVVDGGLDLTDALSSLHCLPAAHSSATGKECRAGLPAPASPSGLWGSETENTGPLGWGLCLGEGCPLTPEDQAWPGSQVSIEKGASREKGDRVGGWGILQAQGAWPKEEVEVWGPQGWSQML